jgi:hypothetical protein
MLPSIRQTLLKKYMSISEASKFLSCSYSKAKELLGRQDHAIKMKNGKMKPLYIKSRVEGIKENIERDKKIRIRRHNNLYSRATYETMLTDAGELVKIEPQFRGRVCAMEGCNEPVPTGHYVCPKHKSEFGSKRKYYLDEYTVHT